MIRLIIFTYHLNKENKKREIENYHEIKEKKIKI
jgi:hypothetical protein